MKQAFQLLIIGISLSLVASSKLRKQDSIQEQNLADEIKHYSNIHMNSLKIVGNAKEDAVIELLNSEQSKYQIIFKAESGVLTIQNNYVEILEVSENQFIIKAQHTRFRNLVFEKDVYVGNVKQWNQIVAENFWNEPFNWSINQITKCGGIYMLGGYGITAKKELQKTFEDIPSHTTIRVTGSFHFIDAWSGEAAFIKILFLEKDTFEYLWTQTYDFSKTKNGINICGSDYVEGQLTSNFDFTIPHSAKSLTLVFGANLQDDPYENSYGISNLKIYSR
ncbi:hypothetical protein ABPG72_015655 [Tetrahymena utriculariae]